VRVPLEQAGYRELEHTADWELEVWGPDITALLEQAAQGMYSLMGLELAERPRQRRRLVIEAEDREGLIVEFLGELLFLQESEGLAFDSIDLADHWGAVHADLEGASIRGQTKEIKAVTFHRLEVRDTPRGLETRIVFDV